MFTAAHLFLKHSGLHVVAHSFAFLSSDLYIYFMCEGKNLSWQSRLGFRDLCHPVQQHSAEQEENSLF